MHTRIRLFNYVYHLNNIGMYLTKEVKAENLYKHGGKAENTGSSGWKDKLYCSHTELLPLTESTLKKNRHDYNTERLLVLLVEREEVS